MYGLRYDKGKKYVLGHPTYYISYTFNISVFHYSKYGSYMLVKAHLVSYISYSNDVYHKILLLMSFICKNGLQDLDLETCKRKSILGHDSTHSFFGKVNVQTKLTC